MLNECWTCVIAVNFFADPVRWKRWWELNSPLLQPSLSYRPSLWKNSGSGTVTQYAFSFVSAHSVLHFLCEVFIIAQLFIFLMASVSLNFQNTIYMKMLFKKIVHCWLCKCKGLEKKWNGSFSWMVFN